VSADPKTLDNKLGAVLVDMALPKSSQQAGQPEEICCEDSGRDPPGDGACGDNQVVGGSQ